MSKYIGKTFENKIGLKYIVESVHHITPKHKFYNIRFIDSGYKTITTSSEIGKKTIKDRLAPVVFGVGCMGYIKKANSKYKREYSVWHDMLNRCYNPKYPEARYYSGAGVTVCDRWLRFEFFLEDMDKLPGWDVELFKSGKIYLDKDLLSGSEKSYSPETCQWLSSLENNPHYINRRNKGVTTIPRR